MIVKQQHDQRLASPARGEHRGVVGILGVADRALPESDVAGRDVEVTGLMAEAIELRCCGADRGDLPGLHDPAVDDRDPQADVAQRQRHVQALLHRLEHRAVAGQRHPVAIAVHDPLGRILGARRREHRALLGEQRPLGDARCAGGGLHRAERRDREHHRARAGRQRGDRHPVRHEAAILREHHLPQALAPG
jgi:hypothetical protein